MAGLRERKRQRTFTAIHEAAMRLFAERGYHAVTVAEIADAAEVSRATVFTYYPAKEEIVFGQAPAALDALVTALDEAGDPAAVVAVVRGWLRTLAGWVEPDLLLQNRLAAEIPAVGAARSRLRGRIEQAIADALERTAGSDPARFAPGPAPHPLAPRLVAGALTAALAVVEQEAAARMASQDGPLPPDEVDRLLDDAVAFVDGGLARLAG
jgi:AcrR family transcriptional regulator